MRLNKRQEIVITRRKAAEIFLLLSNARFKLNGTLRTAADKYWKEFESVLGLDPNMSECRGMCKKDSKELDNHHTQSPGP